MLDPRYPTLVPQRAWLLSRDRESLTSRALASSVAPWVWPHLGALGSATLMALAQPPLNQGWLGPLVLVPWLAATRHSSLLAGVASGALFGLAFGLAVSSWIPEALAVRKADPASAHVGWVVTALWAGALPWAVVAGALATLRRLALPLPLWLGLGAALLFALDTLRSSLVLGVPWALLGHTQATVLGVAQLAAIGGVPLVSALLMAIALAIVVARVGDAEERAIGLPWAGAGLGLWLALASFGTPIAEQAHRLTPSGHEIRDRLRILAVRRPVRYAERWVPAVQRTELERIGLQTLREIEQRAAAPPPELIVWPENALTTPLAQDPLLSHALTRWAQRIDVPIVLGTIEPGEGTPATLRAYRSLARWIAPDGQTRDTFTKTVGVPLIESQPQAALEQALRARFGIGEGARILELGTVERPLHGTPTRETLTEIDLAIALCYEILYPDRIEARRSAETVAIVNPSSDAWLRDPGPVSRQLTAFGRFRAIEQRLPLVRISDGGESIAIDPFGRTRERLSSKMAGSVAIWGEASRGSAALERVALVALALAGAASGSLIGGVIARRYRRYR